MAEKKIRKKTIVLALAFLAIAVIAGLRILYENNQSKRIVNDDCIERNLTTIAYRFTVAPNREARGKPWSSELPDLISDDIEYLKKHPSIHWIEYKYYEWYFYIHVNENGEPYLNMSGYTHPYISDFYDFSFYSDGRDKLVLYGFDLNTFTCYTFEDGDYDLDYITSNKTLPFSEKESFAYRRGDYTVCFPKNRNVVYVYRDYEIVSNEYVVPEELQKMWNGLVIYDDGWMDMLFVVENEDDTVEIRFEPVGALQDANQTYTSMKVEDIEELYLELPMFCEDGKMLIVAPTDWDTYIASRKGETPENPNYQMELISLDEKAFKRVEFVKQNTGSTGAAYWTAYIFYNVNGHEVKYSYSINGYDSRLPCPEELPDKKTVRTEGEFWDFITTIRETYNMYYDYPNSGE